MKRETVRSISDSIRMAVESELETLTTDDVLSDVEDGDLYDLIRRRQSRLLNRIRVECKGHDLPESVRDFLWTVCDVIV